MTAKTRITMAFAALLAATLGATAADFHEGLAAYNRGDYDAAMREWAPLAERGDAESQYRLARMFAHGEGKRDDAAAATWYAKAAEQGHLKAQNNLGLMCEEGRGVERDEARAARWYRAAGEQGLATAQANLGRLYDAGRGVKRDHATAARWYTKAAEQGHANSQYRLGQMFDEGTGVPRHAGKAAKWYRKAARQGHGPAQGAIGTLYAEGRGVSRDLEKAAKWLSRASAQGIAVTHPVFAGFHEKATVAEAASDEITTTEMRVEEPEVAAPAEGPAAVLPPSGPPAEPPPPTEPVRVERAATAQGPVAEAEVPVPADTQTTVPPTREPAAPPAPAPPPAPPTQAAPATPAPSPPPKAAQGGDFSGLRETGRRAERGDREAQYRLAQDLSRGDGAPQSLKDASRWYLAAARQGHAMAAYKVAFLYLRGRGFPNKDYVEAYRWFSVSADRGVGDAAAWRDKIRKKMTDREIAESERILSGSTEAEE